MRTNYNLNDRLGKGYFILNNNYNNNYQWKVYDNIFLTNGENNSLKTQLISLIRNSTTVVKLCSFIITDMEIVDEIINKVKNSDVAIFILTQLDNSKLTNKIDLLTPQEEEIVINSNEINYHLSNIKRLRDSGVHLRAAKDVHAKFAIIDRAKGFIMSANFTSNSFSLNVESGVITDKESSLDLDKLFDVIYLNGTSYKSFLNTKKGKKMLVSEVRITLQAQDLPQQDKKLRFTYGKSHNHLFEEICEIIDAANEFIFISSYSVVGLAKLPEFTDAISRAVLRGVKINIFCRAMNNRLDHLEGCRFLSKLGCLIYGDFYNHSKGIINEKKAMIFTANIDGNYGLKNGFEVAYVLNDNQRSEFLLFHQELIKNCLFNFTEEPLRKEFFEYIAFYEMKKSINSVSTENEIEIIIKNNLKQYFIDFSNALMFIVIFRAQNSKKSFLISIDDNFFNIVMTKNKITVLSKSRAIYNTEKYFLKFTNLNASLSYE